MGFTIKLAFFVSVKKSGFFMVAIKAFRRRSIRSFGTAVGAKYAIADRP